MHPDDVHLFPCVAHSGHHGCWDSTTSDPPPVTEVPGREQERGEGETQVSVGMATPAHLVWETEESYDS